MKLCRNKKVIHTDIHTHKLLYTAITHNLVQSKKNISQMFFLVSGFTFEIIFVKPKNKACVTEY